MKGVNLIPAYRRERKHRRLRKRGWIVCCTGYAAALVAACAVARAAWLPDTKDMARDLAKASKQVAELEQASASARGKLAEANAMLQTVRAVAEQPDWSILLGALGRSVGDDVVLGVVKLDSIREPSGGPVRTAGASRGGAAAAQAAGRQAERWTLELQGHGRSQGSASQFVVRLQETGLFEDVKLMRTNREPFLTGQAVAFQVQCALGQQRSSGK